MTVDFDDEKKPEDDESFASLLEAYSPNANNDLQVGDQIEGKILSIGHDTVFIDTGTKIDGVVEKAELLDENGELSCEENDTLELYVVGLSETEIRLSKALAGIGGLNLLRDAYEKQMPVEGKISETCKGGFQVDVMQRRAFCPISQVDINYVETPEDYVGQTFSFLISQFEGDGKNIVVSRRALLSQEQEKTRKQFYETVTVDSVLDGTITRVMPYGAFVELTPGVEGLAHVSELSWSRSAAPETIVSVGDAVRVKIMGIEPGEKPGQMKIALSMKALSDDPWERVCDLFSEGAKVQGVVTRCADFGAFVEIAPGVEGLVHISEMSYTQRVLKPEDIVSSGETVAVLVKEIDPDKRRISLSLRDAEGDPWLEMPENFKVGQIVEGILEKKEKFGYFIKLAPGITGLLPKSKISKSQKPAAIEALREGDPIAVAISEIALQARKISLAPGDSADEQNWQKFADDTQSSLGSLGEKLQQALAAKKSDD